MGRTLSAEEFEELYRATVHHLIGYMRRRGSTDAENDVAEVYAIAWRRRADLPAPVLRRAWLFGIASKLLLADRRRTAREGIAAAELAQRPEPSCADESSATTSVMAAAMDRLAPGDREILRLVEWERLTTAELATVLGACAPARPAYDCTGPGWPWPAIPPSAPSSTTPSTTPSRPARHAAERSAELSAWSRTW